MTDEERKIVFSAPVRTIQALELETAAQFARAHNRTCCHALGVGFGGSEEDGKPYCRYSITTTESGLGQNYYLHCCECGWKTRFGCALNV